MMFSRCAQLRGSPTVGSDQRPLPCWLGSKSAIPAVPDPGHDTQRTTGWTGSARMLGTRLGVAVLTALATILVAALPAAAATPSVIATIPLCAQPSAVGVDSSAAHTAYVTNRGSGTVSVRSDGQQVSRHSAPKT